MFQFIIRKKSLALVFFFLFFFEHLHRQIYWVHCMLYLFIVSSYSAFTSIIICICIRLMFFVKRWQCWWPWMTLTAKHLWKGWTWSF